MITVNGYSRHQARNGKFCLTIGHFTRTDGILTQIWLILLIVN